MNFTFLFLFLLTRSALAAAAASAGSWRPSRLVRLPQGRLQGEVRVVAHQDGRQGVHQREVEVFLGLPYAEPPTGPLRFMPPVAPQPWPEAVRDARHHRPSCPQLFPVLHDAKSSLEANNLDAMEKNETTRALRSMSLFKWQDLRRARRVLRNQSEDCLTLNIYAPVHTSNPKKEEKESKLSVLVMVEGEQFVWGGGALLDAAVLAATSKLLVVTLNYRLGVLGFLNANRPSTAFKGPANVGLLDQIAALHWIQENIGYFGGDPRQVTLLGHNEGAACVHFLMSSKALPNAKTLFQRVVLMSGSALSPLSLSKTPHRHAQHLGQLVGCEKEKSEQEDEDVDLLSCLRGVGLSRLMTAASRVWHADSRSIFRSVWAPTIDGVVVSAFARRPFAEYLHRMSDFSLMSIVNSGEAAYLTLNERQVRVGFDLDRRFQLLADFVSSVFETRHRDIFSSIITMYTQWNSVGHSSKMYRDESVMAIQDALFVVPVVETLDLHAQDAQSWLMVVDHQRRASDANPRLGCMRGEALRHLLGQRRNLDEDERLMALTIMQYVTNFVRTGNPNARGDSMLLIDDLEPWNQYELDTKAYLHMGLRPRLKSHYRSQQLALWLNLVPDLLDGARRAPSDLMSGTEDKLDSSYLDEYRSHDEMLAFIPKLKSLTASWLSAFASRPASSEVMWPTFENETNEDKSNLEGNSSSSVTRIASNELVLENYSSALSVTVALGCSLLVLNVLIFVAVYHHNHNIEEANDPGLKNPLGLVARQTLNTTHPMSTEASQSVWQDIDLHQTRPMRSSLKKSRDTNFERIQLEQRRQFREHCDMTM